MSRVLEVTGSFRGVTGHDHHTRSIVRALAQRGVGIHLNDFPNWSPAKLPANMRDPWFEQLRRTEVPQVHLLFCMPHQVPTDLKQRKINYTMFEADRIPAQWVERSRQHDLTVVPVDSCRRAWIDSGVPEDKVALCPLGVDADAFAPGRMPAAPSDPTKPNPGNYKVRFLNISDMIDRKNVFGLLRAWLTATDASDDAALILKPGFSDRGAKERFLHRLHELETAVGKSFKDAAYICWLSAVIPPPAMPSLYASATHYLSVSRGEGFDLPMVEAGVSGLQLIAPRHSAYLDYLNDDIAHLISAVPTPARWTDDPGRERMFANANWWEPNHEEICATIRAIIDGKTQPKQSARASLMRMSWAATAERLEQILFE
jgi:glycosyltransferase involved in cell wall biosynthesis